MFEPVLAIADGRVAQLPRERKTFGAPPMAGKTYLSEKGDRFIIKRKFKARRKQKPKIKSVFVIKKEK